MQNLPYLAFFGVHSSHWISVPFCSGQFWGLFWWITGIPLLDKGSGTPIIVMWNQHLPKSIMNIFVFSFNDKKLCILTNNCYAVQILTNNYYAVMSPYEFTSKTYSLSTEDLGKFFIDWLIDWFTFQHPGILYLTQNRSCKIRKNSQKIRKKYLKIRIFLNVAMRLERLCSGFRVDI